MLGTEKAVVVSVRMTPELKRMVDEAATRSGLGLMDWLRAVLARAANEGAFAPPRRTKHGRQKGTLKG
jgi:hypothetical protein